MSTEQDRLKQLAAEKSLEFVESGMKLGLGTGSTASLMVRALGERVRQGLEVVGVPTSVATGRLAEEVGITVSTLDETPRLDLTIDGADEVDSDLNLTKGGGGALLREKVVAGASADMIVIVDASKLVDRLGAFKLPVEVIQFARAPVVAQIEALGARTRLRVKGPGGTPVITDEQNFILDCGFGFIEDPGALAQKLAAIPGVVEHGLFVGFASRVIVARAEGIEVIVRR